MKIYYNLSEFLPGPRGEPGAHGAQGNINFISMNALIL